MQDSWDNTPDFRRTSSWVVAPGGPTQYAQEMERPVGPVATDVTSFHPGQATWSADNLPDVLYILNPPTSWDKYRRRDLPQQKRDRNGNRMFEQWPEDPEHPEPLLDFPHLPDQIGSRENWFIFEAWRRYEPRAHWRDIMMRIHGPSRPSRYNNIQMMLARNRPKFGLVTWFAISIHSEENALRDQALSMLSPSQINRNTTRGTTPGLIDPSHGEAGGRIPFPAPKHGSGRPRGSRAPGKNRGGGNHQPRYQKDEDRTIHTLNASGLDGPYLAKFRERPSQAIIQRAKSAPVSDDHAIFLKSNQNYTTIIESRKASSFSDSNDGLPQSPRRMTFPESNIKASGSMNKDPVRNYPTLLATSSRDPLEETLSFVSHLDHATNTNSMYTLIDQGSKFASDRQIGPFDTAQDAGRSRLATENSQENLSHDQDSSFSELSNGRHKDLPYRKRKSDVSKEEDEESQILERRPNRKFRHSDRVTLETVRKAPQTFRSLSVTSMRPEPVLPQDGRRSASSQGIKPHPGSGQSYESGSLFEKAGHEHIFDENLLQKRNHVYPGLKHNQDYTFAQLPNGLYNRPGHANNPSCKSNDSISDCANYTDQPIAALPNSDFSFYSSDNSSCTSNTGESSDLSQTLDPDRATSEFQQALSKPLRSYDNQVPPTQSLLNYKAAFPCHTPGGQVNQGCENRTFASNFEVSEMNTTTDEPRILDYTDGLGELLPQFEHYLSSEAMKNTDLAYWGSEDSTTYINGLEFDLNEPPEAKFFDVKANMISHSLSRITGPEGLWMSVDQRQDGRESTEDSIEDSSWITDYYPQELASISPLSQVENAFDDPNDLPAWHL